MNSKDSTKSIIFSDRIFFLFLEISHLFLEVDSDHSLSAVARVFSLLEKELGFQQGYLFEFHSIDRTYYPLIYWNKKNQIHTPLHNIQPSRCPYLNEHLKGDYSFCLDKKTVLELSPDEQEIMHSVSVQHTVFYPLFHNKSAYGLLGFDYTLDFPVNSDLQNGIIQSILPFFASFLHKRKSDIVLWHHLEEARNTISELEKAIAETNQKALNAEIASIAKSTFLSTMSHELRTPMNGITGMVHLLKASNLSSDQKNNLHILSESAESLLTILNDILDISKIEANKLELESIDFNLLETIDSVIEVFSSKINEKHLQSGIILHHTVPLRLRGDMFRFRQILINLIGNSVKFTNSGSIRTDIHLAAETNNEYILECSVKDTGIGIEEKHLPLLFDSFSQVDSTTTRRFGGTGLGLAICKNLCTMMQGTISVVSKIAVGTEFIFTVRMNKTGDKNDKLGLLTLYASILKQYKLYLFCPNPIIKDMFSETIARYGLTCSLVESKELLFKHLKEEDNIILVLNDVDPIDEILFHANKELKLIVVNSSLSDMALPPLTPIIKRPYTMRSICIALIRVIDSNYLWETPFEENKTIIVPKQISILIAEDNAINQKVIEGMLKGINCQIKIASNGKEALTFFEKEPYDLIFMDVQMPEMDGLETTKLIRKKEYHHMRTPIIAMTAHALKEDRERCLQYGMDDYISKPIQYKEILRVILRFIAGSHLLESENKTNQKSSASFDPQELLQRMGGNKQFTNEIIILAIQQFPLYLQQIKDALVIEDYHQLRLHLHTLKGAAANLCAESLALLAETFESQVKNNNSDTYKKCYLQLEDECLSLLQSLQHEKEDEL